VFVKPDEFSWKFMRYENPSDDLILSDVSKIFKDPEPVDKPEGENLALIMDFVLPSSAYATMALREIMKCDTSVGSQITLEAEVKKKAEGKNGAAPMDEGQVEAGNKRAISDSGDEGESKKMKVE
jgi:tRNA pseudouridine13 synthase